MNDLFLIYNQHTSHIHWAHHDQPITYADERFILVGPKPPCTYHVYTAVSSDLTCFVYCSRHENVPEPQRIFADYQKAGIKGITNYPGRFLIIIYDKQRRTLELVRDRVGLQHIYCAEYAGSLFLATSLRVIVALLHNQRGVLPDFDPVSLGYYVTSQYLPNPATIFSGISQLPCETVLHISPDRMHYLTLEPYLKEETTHFARKQLHPLPDTVRTLLVAS